MKPKDFIIGGFGLQMAILCVLLRKIAKISLTGRLYKNIIDFVEYFLMAAAVENQLTTKATSDKQRLRQLYIGFFGKNRRKNKKKRHILLLCRLYSIAIMVEFTLNRLF